MTGTLLVGAGYLLGAVFLIAFAMRTLRLAKLPVHLRWELAPIPHEKGKGQYGGSYFEEVDWWTRPREKSLLAEAIYMFWEIVFLRGIWEKNRRLWWFSFPFHMGLYCLIAAAPFVALSLLFSAAGASLDWPDTAVLFLAGSGFLLGAAGTVGLLVSRLVDSRLSSMTTPESLFNLALLLALFLSGGIALQSGGFSSSVTSLTKAFLTADFDVHVSTAIGVHAGIAFAFLAYLPFTPMMHFVAKYFTYHEVRWDDKPLEHGGPVEKEVEELLGQKVGWAGKHLGADGTRNWVDIATGDGKP